MENQGIEKALQNLAEALKGNAAVRNVTVTIKLENPNPNKAKESK